MWKRHRTEVESLIIYKKKKKMRETGEEGEGEDGGDGKAAE